MTIQETAGRLLVYFYQLQKTAPLQVRTRQFIFTSDHPTSRLSLVTDKRWLTSDLQSISKSGEDMLNAMLYLQQLAFIRTTERSDSQKRVYTGCELTAKGVAIIEAVSFSDEGVDNFSHSFGMHIDGPISLDGLTEQMLSAK